MTSLPEDRDPWNHPEEATTESSPAPSAPTNGATKNPDYAPWGSAAPGTPLPVAELHNPDSPDPDSPVPDSPVPEPPIAEPPAPDPSLADFHPELTRAEPPNFAQFEPPPPPPERIPNFVHLCILVVMLLIGLLCTSIIVGLSLRHHLFGVSTKEQAITNIHYTLGSEALLYLFTLVACVVIFPLVWHKGFFAGLQWNAATALRLRWRLFSAAGICFLFAFLDSVLVPGPSNAPIDKIFREPGAAWLLFAFGITFAPFFEEMFFRGFLLPALCTAYDSFAERKQHRPRPPLAENGHPQWTMPAMVTGAILTSLPFAALHGQQTGYSWGPFVLLVGVSIVLCAIRLSTRSLASSVLVHSSYNFMLFVFMLIGTHGFKHLGKM